MIKKYFQDFLSYQLSHLIGGRKYDTWATKTLTLQKNIPIKNKNLARELESACAKNGFLTYAEFLHIDQFGENGYHNTHRQHGMTDTKFRWPEALAVLCKEKGFTHIVEFGSGDGEVGARTLVHARKLKHHLFWSGVEINKNLQEKTHHLFRKKRLQKQLIQLVSNLEELDLKEKCLFVFSYSLDNLIPEVFINTLPERHFPNAIVGVEMKEGMVSEMLIEQAVIPGSDQESRSRVKPGMTTKKLSNGIYTDSFGFSWDLHEWQLNPMQRTYLPLEVCRTLLQTANILPLGSQILIVDEFRIADNHQQTPYHLGLPRDLETFSRDFTDMEKFYRTAGSNLLYFPMFLDLIVSFLSQLGFSLEENSGEHTLAFRLSGRNDPVPKHPRTLALLTSPKMNEVNKTKFVLKAPLK